METIRVRFIGIEKEKLDKAIAAALKKVKAPKIDKMKWAGNGPYNALALPVVPYEVVSVKDAGPGGDPVYRVVHQQVIATANMRAPVTIEYISIAEKERWRAEMIAAVQEEVDK